MSDKPLVSVIMIFLNAEKFIQEAIDSVFAQTYDSWELLLVDDGSTDSSTEITLRCAEQNPNKVHYLEHENHQNQGMSASRNLGIHNAKGKYITFLDSDDVWLPLKLEQQVAILKSQPEAALVCGPAQYWYSWTGRQDDIHRDFVQQFDVQLNTVVKPPKLLTQFLQDEWATLCDMLVRCEVVGAVGGYEESFRGMYEDQVFHAKVCLRLPVFVSGEYWYQYRQHPNACTFSSYQLGQANTARLVFLNWLEEYLFKQGIKDIEIWQVLQKQLWPYRHPRLYHLLERYRYFIGQIKNLVKLIGRQTLPIPARHWLRAQWRGAVR